MNFRKLVSGVNYATNFLKICHIMFTAITLLNPINFSINMDVYHILKAKIVNLLNTNIYIYMYMIT